MSLNWTDDEDDGGAVLAGEESNSLSRLWRRLSALLDKLST